MLLDSLRLNPKSHTLVTPTTASALEDFSKKVISSCFVKLDREEGNDILGRGNNTHQGPEAWKNTGTFERP